MGARRDQPDPWTAACRACLLGGAVGDALGAPVEFHSAAEIARRHGPAGIDAYPGGVGHITDDTQMTLFTAEGLIRAEHARRHGAGHPPPTVEVVWSSYLRWLLTQDHHPDEDAVSAHPAGLRSGWLLTRRELWAPRAPGFTCLGSLRSGRMGRPDAPINDSKGCGGVMRVAPVGLVSDTPFRDGAEAAATTHTHPTGYLSAGVLAAVVAGLAEGAPLLEAVAGAVAELAAWEGSAETGAAVRAAVDLAARHPVPDPELVATLGGGWVADEALAIALYCALCAPDARSGLVWAVNHSGDSDSTGAIAGNLLGLVHGLDALPVDLVDGLAEREVVRFVADDLARAFPRGPVADGPDATAGGGDLLERYPATP